MGHWKQLTNPKYMGAYSMDGIRDSIDLTIQSVKSEEITGEGGKKSYKAVVTFKEKIKDGVKIKPMIFNSGNSKEATKLAKSPIVSNWAGVVVNVYILRGYIPNMGDRTPIDVLRVKAPNITTQKEVMSKDHVKYEGMIEAIKNDKFSIEQLQKSFTVSAQVLADIKKEVANA